MTSADDVFVATLELAVPLAIRELQVMPERERVLAVAQWGAEAARQVGSSGDVLMFKGKREGHAARVFSHLVRGMAALAHQPEGVTAFGMHWCLDYPGGRPASGGGERCASAGFTPLPVPRAAAVGVIRVEPAEVLR